VLRDLDTRRFVMFYEATDDSGSRSIGLAVSDDGRGGWRHHPEPVLCAADEGSGGWDSGGVGAPCAVQMAAGRWRLYYAGKEPGESAWRGFGIALSEEGSADLAGVPVSFARRTE
jgi:predicted GH43/DUF377 family glycosyl hydrolase